jgi:hypothetical protein
MKRLQEHIVLFLTATLFAASTVCCILDDKWIDHSKLNYAHTHECFATNCPVCGAQYQPQFETQHLQKGIQLVSDEICDVLVVAYRITEQEPFPTTSLFEISSKPSFLSQPFPLPLRI